MTKVYITSPVEGLNTSTAIGPLVLNFKDSVAEVDSADLSKGLSQYLKTNGYGVGSDEGGSEATGRKADTPQPPDPRTSSTARVGTPIRDAAVDPRDKDFLEPINAGKRGKAGNPHSQNVVSPEIHASEGIRPVKGGPVHVDDPGAQAASEKGHAADATDGTPVQLTAEERDLLGLDDTDEDTSDPQASAQGDGDPNPQGDPDSESTGDPGDAGSDSETPVEELKGEALTEALKAADLPVSGSAQEKRDRLAQHRAQG